MVLIAIVGSLGAGKTLTAVFTAVKNYLKGRTIFSNITLYGIPFYRVDSIPDIMQLREGFFLADELWLSLDSRMIGQGARIRNKVIGDILARSRKRKLIIAYTSQTLSQIDKRIRMVTDFVFVPQLNRRATVCTVMVFRGYKVNPATYAKTIRFVTAPIFRLYNSNEEVEELKLEDTEPMKKEYHPISENPTVKGESVQ